MTPDGFKGALTAYLESRLPGRPKVMISELHRIYGGASRETYRVRIIEEAPGGPRRRGFILRRDPTGSLIDTDRRTEFLAYSSFKGAPDVPVPEAHFLEMDESILERPFFVMEEIEDCQTASPFANNPYGDKAEVIGKQFWTILGRISARDPLALPVREVMQAPALDECWKRELDYWEGVIDEDALSPQPIVRAAIRRLRASPPPSPKKLSLVHGDYRTGNFLFDGEGTIRGILDWEMAHMGDAHEDIAWAADPLWSLSTPTRPSGLIGRVAALDAWEAASGLKVDPEALAWWSLFAMVKGLAIWISSSHEFASGVNQDPVLAFSGWFCTATHNRLLAERMAGYYAEVA